jgi:hypothetical protein
MIYVEQMRWHKEEIHDSEYADIMSHPMDAKAWQTIDRFDPEFIRDPRSVRHGLSTDGFQLYSSDSTAYSCWPVFVMPYNLSPNKYLKEGFIFLAIIILGPKEPKKQMNIFLRPSMEELKELWQGVDAYDSHMKCLPICGQFMIIWHMTNLPTSVFMVDSIVPYAWMTLMHSG